MTYQMNTPLRAPVKKVVPIPTPLNIKHMGAQALENSRAKVRELVPFNPSNHTPKDCA
jgi:hypothetical protein